MTRYCETFNRERIGFRSRWVSFVWYVQRGTVEAWIGKSGVHLKISRLQERERSCHPPNRAV